MTCANVLLTVAAVVTVLCAVWPGFGSVTAQQWVVGIAMAVVVAVAWSGVSCKYCAQHKPARKK